MNILLSYRTGVPDEIAELATKKEIAGAIHNMMRRYKQLIDAGDIGKTAQYSEFSPVIPSKRIYPADMMPWKSLMDKYWEGLNDEKEWPIITKTFAEKFFLENIGVSKLSKTLGLSRRYLYYLLDGRKRVSKKQLRYSGLYEYFFLFYIKHGF